MDTMNLVYVSDRGPGRRAGLYWPRQCRMTCRGVRIKTLQGGYALIITR